MMMSASKLASILTSNGITIKSSYESDTVTDASIELSNSMDVQIANRKLILNRWEEDSEGEYLEKIGSFRCTDDLIIAILRMTK